MLAGLLDPASPRPRAHLHHARQRAARALASLMMHDQEYTIEEAAEFASAWTPRGGSSPETTARFVS